MTPERILVLGATSGIAEATAKLLAKPGASFVLVSRSPEKLKPISDDLRARGAKTSELIADLADTDLHQNLIEEAQRKLDGFDLVYIAYGVLEDQKNAQTDFALAERYLQTNFISVVSLLTLLLPIFEKQGFGSVAVISSVAGDGGRYSNYVYGASKAGLSAYLQGYRSRLSLSKVHVLTIKPGPVKTPMTEHLKKSPHGLFMVSPEYVAKDIVRAIRRKKEVLYTPWYWRAIMGFARFVPERFAKRSKF